MIFLITPMCYISSSHLGRSTLTLIGIYLKTSELTELYNKTNWKGLTCRQVFRLLAVHLHLSVSFYPFHHALTPFQNFERNILPRYPSLFYRWFICAFPDPGRWIAARRYFVSLTQAFRSHPGTPILPRHTVLTHPILTLWHSILTPF